MSHTTSRPTCSPGGAEERGPSARARVEPLEVEGRMDRPDGLLRVLLRHDEGEVLVRGARRYHPDVYPLRGDRAEGARGDALDAPHAAADHRDRADVVLGVDVPEPSLPQERELECVGPLLHRK